MKLSSRVNHLTFFCVLAVMTLASPISFAADAKSSVEKTTLTYEMKQGDTLLALVAKYFVSDSALTEITRINQIKNPYKIPVGQKLTFPRELLVFSDSQAHLTSLDCAEPVLIAGENKSLRLGDLIVQGALIKVPKGCEAGMTLEDASVVSLLPGTLVRIKTLRKTRLEKSPEVELELLGGRIELDVPKRQAGDAPYQVRTPSSLAGVRGTKFKVAFDADQHNSQVEVNHGNVAARGSADKENQFVRDNMGVVISAYGVSSPVETLPLPPIYLGAEAKSASSNVLLKFSANSPDGKQQDRQYLVAQSDHANFVTRSAGDVYANPTIEAKNLSIKAAFYQLASLSKSGLIGEARYYGFCKSSDPQRSQCNVNFNMRGLQTVDLRLQRLNSDSNVFEEVIHSTLTTAEGDQFLFKGLPSGHYQWDIAYVVDGGIPVMKSGTFDLVAIHLLASALQ